MLQGLPSFRVDLAQTMGALQSRQTASNAFRSGLSVMPGEYAKRVTRRRAGGGKGYRRALGPCGPAAAPAGGGAGWPARCRRQAAGGTPTSFLKARLNAASEA